jgi:twitching motility two-component system response regulator PilH
VRVLQNGRVLARLSAVRRLDDRLIAIWHGPPPPFMPSEQIEPFVLESDNGLERNDAWLYSVLRPSRGESPLRVEIGAEKNAPPWRQSKSPPDRQSTPSGHVEPATPQDILVVDDDPETVDLVGEALEEQGFTVRRALGGREALVKIAERPPDVAIVDLIMPEVGGEQVCSFVRRDPRSSHTRILVLSGAEDTRVVAAACDADSAVTKPFTTELLMHEVRRLTGQ